MRSGQKKPFHAPWNARIETAARAGPASGSIFVDDLSDLVQGGLIAPSHGHFARGDARRWDGAFEQRFYNVGIGSILANELAADARAAGITQLVATVCGDNPRVMALLKRLGSLSLTWRGGERELVIGLEH